MGGLSTAGAPAGVGAGSAIASHPALQSLLSNLLGIGGAAPPPPGQDFFGVPEQHPGMHPTGAPWGGQLGGMMQTPGFNPLLPQPNINMTGLGPQKVSMEPGGGQEHMAILQQLLGLGG